MPNESRTRSIIKALSWQLLGLLTMTLVALVITGDLSASGGLAIASATVSFFCFFVHERLWARIRWGRADIKEQTSL